MSDLVAKRTGWDLVLGGLLVVVGIVVLSHAVVATAVSVLFIGWFAFVAGVVTVFMALFELGKEGFWPAIMGGGLLAVVGFVMIRNPGAAAVTLTLMLGTAFLVTGIARLAASARIPEARVALIVGGSVSTLLGLLVLLNLFDASFTLLGVLLGIEVLVEGVSIMVAGRATMRLPRARPGAPAAT